MKGLSWILVSLTLCRGISAATSIRWDTINPYPGLPALWDVTYGSGRFVAAGEEGLFYSNDQGKTWLPGTNSTGSFRAITFAANRFVAAGSDIRSSEDGRTWAVHSLPGHTNFWMVASGNGVFVALEAGAGVIATSPDAEHWTTAPFPGSEARLLAFGNGQFLAIEPPTGSAVFNYPMHTSVDGTHWTTFLANVPTVDPNCAPSRLGPPCEQFTTFTGVAFTDGQFVINAQYGLSGLSKTIVSDTGSAWTIVGNSIPGGSIIPGGLGGSIDRLFDANGQLAYLDIGARVTTNLLAWSTLTLPVAPPTIAFGGGFTGIAYGESTYVVVGYHQTWGVILRGEDLNHLERVDGSLHLADLVSIAAAGETLVAVGPSQLGGSLFVSTNSGRGFQSVDLPAGANPVTSVAYAQAKFLAVGPGGTVLRSTNGLAWSKRLSNTTRDLSEVAFGGDMWIAVGANGLIISSTDGSFFSLRNSNTEVNLRGVTFGEGTFVAVGDSGAILKSATGQDWMVQGTEDALDLNAVAFGNNRFVAVGTNGIVQVSTNGDIWTPTLISGVATLSHIAFANGLFVAIERNSETAYQSEDGWQWIPTTAERPLLGVQESDGALWVSGSYAYIAKARAEAVSRPSLEGSIDEHGLFTLSFQPITPGDYQILASPTLQEGSWSSVAVLTNATGRVDWTDPATPVASRFYQVVPVPGL